MDNNVLVQYKGGGYDGCWWEWNFAAMIDGEFVDIFSSGYKGCDTQEKLEHFMEDAKKDKYDYNSSDYYIYKIPYDLEGFANDVNAGLVMGVANKLAEFDIFLEAKCAQCGEVFPVHEEFMTTGNYKSMGGISYAPTDFICIECYCTPSEVEIEEAMIDLANDLRRELTKKFRELDDLDPDFKLYEKLVNALIKKSGANWEKEEGTYVYIPYGAEGLMKHLSENMLEFKLLFGEIKPPKDAILRELGFEQLPGFEGV